MKKDKLSKREVKQLLKAVKKPEFYGKGTLEGVKKAKKLLQQKAEEGNKFDGEKVRYDLLPLDALEDVAWVLTKGAKKYGEHNWEKGMSWGRCFAAALRHLFAFWLGKDNDPEWGLPSLAHALCCIFFLLAYQKRKIGVDDRVKQKDFQ